MLRGVGSGCNVHIHLGERQPGPEHLCICPFSRGGAVPSLWTPFPYLPSYHSSWSWPFCPTPSPLAVHPLLPKDPVSCYWLKGLPVPPARPIYGFPFCHTLLTIFWSLSCHISLAFPRSSSLRVGILPVSTLTSPLPSSCFTLRRDSNWPWNAGEGTAEAWLW